MAGIPTSPGTKGGLYKREYAVDTVAEIATLPLSDRIAVTSVAYCKENDKKYMLYPSGWAVLPTGGGGSVTKSAIVQALGYTPVNNVHLWSDGNAFFYFDDKDDQENPLTYAQVKAIIEDDINSVFLTNGNYSFYGKYKLVPGIAGENGIGFVGETQLDRDDGRRVYSYMMVMHEDSSVTIHEVRLAKNSEMKVVEEDIAALKAALIGVSELIGGDE